jgi:hypothetical protein
MTGESVERTTICMGEKGGTIDEYSRTEEIVNPAPLNPLLLPLTQ